MLVQLIALPVLAAAAGTLMRLAAGYLAERTGHSREAAQDAIASAGLSLVVTPRRRPDGHGGANARP